MAAEQLIYKTCRNQSNDDAFDRIVEPFLKHNANTQYTGQAMILEKAFMVKILTQNLEVKSVIIPPGACTLVAS